MTSYRSFTRRHLLRGAGGFALAIPFLPSMAGRRGFAGPARPPGAGAPCFVAFATHHGGVWATNMYPDDRSLRDQRTYAGRMIRAAPLSGERSGENHRLSMVLSANRSRLTERLIAQMNVIRGLDVPWYIAHHTGGHLGNFARNDANGSDGLRMQAYPSPTIDQVLGWSDRFYPDPAQIVERAMVVGGRQLSYTYANPAARAGQIQVQPSYGSNVDLFNRVFRPTAAFGAVSPLVVDRVMDTYRDVMADPRLSTGDRRRLDEHMERLLNVERRLNLELPCEGASPLIDTNAIEADPAFFRDPDAQARYWQLMNDVVVAAFACGVSRVASMHVLDTLSTFSGDWHQDIAHQAHIQSGAAQQTLSTAHQQFFANIFLDLVEKMDATENASGNTLLADSLVVWSQESGQYTHESFSIPVVTAGSACGSIRAGQYIDYRDLTTPLPYDGEGSTFPEDFPGLTWNQYLGTILQTMGLSPTDYETEPGGGYGPMYVAPDRPYYAEAVRVAGEPLPLLT